MEATVKYTGEVTLRPQTFEAAGADEAREVIRAWIWNQFGADTAAKLIVEITVTELEDTD